MSRRRLAGPGSPRGKPSINIRFANFIKVQVGNVARMLPVFSRFDFYAVDPRTERERAPRLNPRNLPARLKGKLKGRSHGAPRAISAAKCCFAPRGFTSRLKKPYRSLPRIHSAVLDVTVITFTCSLIVLYHRDWLEMPSRPAGKFRFPVLLAETRAKVAAIRQKRTGNSDPTGSRVVQWRIR